MDTIVDWLQTFPHWKGSLTVDSLQGKVDSCGIYPLGVRVLERKQDILGNARLRLQSRYQLRRTVALTQDNGHHARWLRQLQEWILEQSCLQLAPKLGEDTRWSVGDGKLEKDRRPGVGLYTVTLEAEYTV